MRAPGGKGWLGAILVGVCLTFLACGLDPPAPEDELSEFSAERLDLEDESILDILEPEERAAVERAGVSGARPAHVTPAAESKSDTAGKVGLSVLTVALSVGAAVAPFLLF
jgi:hypothetical protein